MHAVHEMYCNNLKAAHENSAAPRAPTCRQSCWEAPCTGSSAHKSAALPAISINWVNLKVLAEDKTAIASERHFTILHLREEQFG